MEKSKFRREMIPAHVKAVERLKEIIVRTGYRVGDELPSYERLVDRLGISYVTVKKTMDMLAEEGIVRVSQGKGTVLRRLVAGPGKSISRIAMASVTTRHGLAQFDYFMEVLSGMLLESHVLHADIELMSIRDVPDLLVSERLARAGIQGLLLFGVRDPNVAQSATNLRLPVVAIDNYIPNIAMESVVFDNDAASGCIMKHLANLGHRRIHYVDGGPVLKRGLPSPGGYSSDDVERREAYLRFMVQNGWEHYSKVHVSSALPPVEQLISGAAAPTAFVTKGTGEAAEIIEHLSAAGLRVPDDISVASCMGSTEERRWKNTTITCSRGFFVEMGRMAVHLLNRAHANPEPSRFVIHRIGSCFEPGQTAGPARP